MNRYKYLIIVIISGVLLLIGPANSDWKVLPRSIVVIWYVLTSVVLLSETYSKLVHKYKFGSFKEGGSFEHREYQINVILVILTTIIVGCYYSIR